eukprot:968135-Prorocentrum_minimum.AAC.1
MGYICVTLAGEGGRGEREGTPAQVGGAGGATFGNSLPGQPLRPLLLLLWGGAGGGRRGGGGGRRRGAYEPHKSRIRYAVHPHVPPCPGRSGHGGGGGGGDGGGCGGAGSAGGPGAEASGGHRVLDRTASAYRGGAKRLVVPTQEFSKILASPTATNITTAS